MSRFSVAGKWCALVWFVLAQPLHAENLVAGINDWLPWQYADHGVASGIVVDIFKAAAIRAGCEPVIAVIPQIRRNTEEWGKQVHAELGVVPEWREAFSEVSVYTIPFVTTRDVILAKRGRMREASSVNDFLGKRVGATLGYFYPDGFSEAFDDGRLVRDNSPGGSILLKKLLDDRIDAAILNEHEARYWMEKLNANEDVFETVYVFIAPLRLRMRLHADKKRLIPALNAALTDMLEEGAIDNIVRKHIGWWDGHEQRFSVCPAHARNSMPAEMDSDEAR